MITEYTKAEIQHIVRVHQALKKDYTNLYRKWQLAQNPIQKQALANRLLKKAARLEQLSTEIKELAVNDSIMEEEFASDVAVEDYEPVALNASYRNVSFQILIWIVGLVALALIVHYLIGSK